MRKRFTVTCSRCGSEVEGMQDEHFTAGFYLVGPRSAWSRYAREGETHLCDPCMWADPEYRRTYGIHDAVAPEYLSEYPIKFNLEGPQANA